MSDNENDGSDCFQCDDDDVYDREETGAVYDQMAYEEAAQSSVSGLESFYAQENPKSKGSKLKAVMFRMYPKLAKVEEKARIESTFNAKAGDSAAFMRENANAEDMCEIERTAIEKEQKRRGAIRDEIKQRQNAKRAFTSEGYKPSELVLYDARVKRYAEEGVKVLHSEAIKELEIGSTRFMAFNNGCDKGDFTEFYRKPCSLCCLWCTETFDNPPLPMPRRVTSSFGGVARQKVLGTCPAFIFYVHGHYCSPSCVLAAAHEMGVHLSRDLKPLVWHMLRSVYKVKSNAKIGRAPDRSALKKFGGNMDIDAFRATGGLSISTRVLEMPIVPFLSGIEELEKTKTTLRETLAPGTVRDFIIKTTFHNFQSVAIRDLIFRADTSTNASANTQSKSVQPDANRMQRGGFATLPTIEEQLRISERKLVLEKQVVGEDPVKKKRKTLFDYMHLEQVPVPKPPLKNE